VSEQADCDRHYGEPGQSSCTGESRDKTGTGPIRFPDVSGYARRPNVSHRARQGRRDTPTSPKACFCANEHVIASLRTDRACGRGLWRSRRARNAGPTRGGERTRPRACGWRRWEVPRRGRRRQRGRIARESEQRIAVRVRVRATVTDLFMTVPSGRAPYTSSAIGISVATRLLPTPHAN